MTDVLTPTEDLTTLTDDELSTLLGELETEFDQLHDSGAGDVAAAEALACRIEAARTERSKRSHPSQAPASTTASFTDRRRPSLAAVASRAPSPRRLAAVSRW